MKTKLILLCLALFCGLGGVKADKVVKIANSTSGPNTNGTTLSMATGNNPDFSSTTLTLAKTWTSNNSSGLAGLTVSTTNATLFSLPELWSQNPLCLHLPSVGATETVTITAPSGYYIKYFTLKVAGREDGDSYDVKWSNGSFTTSHKAWTTMYSNNTTTSISFSVKGNSATNNRFFIIGDFSVTLAEIPDYSSGYTSLAVSQSNGNKLDSWGTKWTSTVAPVGTTLTCSVGDMKVETNVTLHSANTNGNPTYTIKAPTGYYIAGYTMTIYADAAGQYITPNGCAKVEIGNGNSNSTTLYVAGVNSKTTTFTRTFASSGGSAYATSFTIYFKPTYTVTYAVVDGEGTTVVSKATEQFGDVTLSIPDILNTRYCVLGSFYSTSACTGTAISEISSISSDQTVYCKYSNVNAPVNFASAVDGVGAQKYTLSLRTRPFYRSSDALAVGAENGSNTSEDAQWIFTGDIFGTYVYNVGSGKYLVMSGNSPALSDTPAAWIVSKHNNAGFTLYLKNNEKFLYVNSSGNIVSSTGYFSEGSGDNYSASFVATELAEEFKDDVVSNIQPYFTTGVGNNFGLKQSVYDANISTVTDALTTCNASTYSTLYGIIENASNFVYPESGFYRIKNYSTGVYLGKTGDDPTIEFGGSDAASVLYLTRSGVEGSYKYSIGIQGANVNSLNTTYSTGDFTMSVVAPGRFTMNDFSSNTVFGYTYANGSAVAADNLGIGGDAAYWTIEDASTVTIALNPANDNTSAAHTYATLCVPFEITDLEGNDDKDVKAYVPTKEGDYIVPGNGASSVTEGTPVLLIGEEGATSVTATIGSNYATSPATTNVLTGTFIGTSIDTSADSNNYLLGKDAANSNRIGFYHFDSTSYALKANRAYLNTAVSLAKGFILMFDEGDATGVGSLAPDQSVEEGTIYNLSGQRVSKVQKGIFIINGKKVLK